MEECAFGPGVNWHGPRVVDCLGPDCVIYASKGHIIVLKWNEDGYSMKSIPFAHYNRVNALAAAPHNAAEPLSFSAVSCGTDGFVRLWNLDNLTITKAHKTHAPKNTVKSPLPVTGISWSRADPNLVMSVASNGCLVVWHLAENVTRKYSHRNANFSSVACSPIDPSVVAACDGGAILLLTLTPNGMNSTRLRCFQSSITDLAWQPHAENPLLAASSDRGEISFWNVKSEKYVRCLTGFTPQGDTRLTNIHPVAWADVDTLLGRFGRDLIAFDIKDTVLAADSDPDWRDGGRSWRVVHSPHRNGFFTLACSSQGGLVWSAGNDRALTGTDVSAGKAVRKMGTLFGGVIMASVSPHDSNLIALGGADGSVKIWNVTKTTGSTFYETRNVQDKVMSVCWHPELDSIVIYGTSAGRIGVMETQKGYPPSLLVPSTNKAVYWLCWGPPFFPAAEGAPKLVLYAVANSSIYMYTDINDRQAAPRNIGRELALECKAITDMAWKPDHSLLAVGCKDGSISLLKPSTSIPALTLSVRESVQYLVWHPQMTSTDSELSPFHNLLTCGSRARDGVITVFKIEQTAASLEGSVFAKLEGHLDYVQSVAWSPHLGGLLVSSSADTSVQVWNVLDETPIANYQSGNGEACSFAIWSPVHSDYIISGLRESAIVVWKISSRSEKLPKSPIRNPYKKLTGVKDMHSKSDMAVESKPNSQPNVKVLKKRVMTANEGQASQQSGAQVATKSLSGKAEAVYIFNAWARKGSETDTCSRLLRATSDERPGLHSLCFLSTDDVMYEKLGQLDEYHKADGHIDIQTATLMWQGKLKELLEQKIQDGGLTDTLVSLAPSVSPRLWQQACSAYARQLRVARRFAEASNYLLASRQVEEAVQVLLEGKMYHEAMCLARIQLPGGDPAFRDAVEQYATLLAEKGRHGKAAECFIYLEEFGKAARCLANCSDVTALCGAALAARRAQDATLEREMALTAMCLSIQREDHQTIENLASEHCQFESVKLLHAMYTALRNPYKDGGEPLLEAVKESVALSVPKECYAHLNMIHPKQAPTVSGRDQVIVRQLSLACCAVTSTSRQRHVLRALEASQFKSSAELCVLCQRLSPGLAEQGVFSAEGGIGTSLRGFLCLALLHRASALPDEAPSCLSRIVQLQADLLDEKAFSYYRGKSELPALQKQLTDRTVTVKSKKENVEEVTGDVVNDPELVLDNSSCESLQAVDQSIGKGSISPETLEDGVTHSADTTDTEDSGNDDDNSTEKLENGDIPSLIDANSSQPLNTKGVTRKESTKTVKLVKKTAASMASLVEERNRLVMDISRMEAERTVIPNPAMGFMLIRSFCMDLGEENDTAQKLIADISEKCLRWMQ